MKPKPAKRVLELPPYIFAELDKAKEKAIKQGRSLVDLSIGDPDLSPPKRVIERMRQALLDERNHRYPSYVGKLKLRQAIANYFERRFGVRFAPENEVLVLIGSKEGIAHLMLAYLDVGDVALIPDPCFPMYITTARFAGAEVVRIPLLPERNFLPDLSAIPTKVLQKAKLLVLNYPNNPTGAQAPLEFFYEAVEFARKNNLLILQDAAYAEVYTNKAPHSIFEAEGARECAIEVHSFSKTFSAAGWRLGFAVADSEVLYPLARVKDQIDSGVFDVVQEGGIEAISMSEEELNEIRNAWRARRQVAVEELKRANLQFFDGGATLYLLIKLPNGAKSNEFCTALLEEEGVLTTPGIGFGKQTEGWMRIALCTPEEQIREGVRRIARFFDKWREIGGGK